MTESGSNAAESAPVVVGSLLGRVKWFRNGPGYGYGFITCVSENVPLSGQDVYVYQQNICPSVSTFRTLVKDVSFDVSEEERPQALNVRGVGGGPLRCDAPRPRPRQRRNNKAGDSSGSAEASAEASH